MEQANAELRMQIVIIGGLPCSGKSKFAERLQKRWRRPMVCKDAFKESLFDTLGTGDRAWSRRLSVAAYGILFQQAEELLRSGTSCIVEGNFREREHCERLSRLSRLAIRCLQVHCLAEPATLIARFRERAHSGLRHPGHVDIESLEEIEREMLSSPQSPLAVDGTIVECDTTGDWQTAIDRAVDEVLRLVEA
jgi:predicted kinase